MGRRLPMTYRRPVAVFISAGLIAALVLHGLSWLMVAGILTPPPQAFGEALRQVGLGLWWVLASLFLWSFHMPDSRLKAAAMTLACALFIGLVGSLSVVIAQIQNPSDYSASVRFMVLLSVLLGQTALAIPASAVLQWIVLSSDPKLKGLSPPGSAES